MGELLPTGGPHDVRRTGADQYSMSISLPKEDDGRVSRECVDALYSPGAFKLRPGTGIQHDHVRAYCPYCRKDDKPENFATADQVRYARDVAMGQISKGVDKMVKDAFQLGASGRRKFGGGFISMEVSYKPSSPKTIRRPATDQVRRDVVCPHCGLDHSVFGLARWCPDCGEDIFLTHVEAEFSVVRAMVSDIERREQLLGTRVALKDLENCLEDVVSIFEAVLRLIARQMFQAAGTAQEEIEIKMKSIGNAFQNIQRAEQIFSREFSVNLLSGIAEPDRQQLEATFEKRHPIVHNLGIVDRKYLERVQSAEKAGREVMLDQDELLQAVQTCMAVVVDVGCRQSP
jgi:hypothetical protein